MDGEGEEEKDGKTKSGSRVNRAKRRCERVARYIDGDVPVEK